jgi:hypothetical protein
MRALHAPLRVEPPEPDLPVILLVLQLTKECRCHYHNQIKTSIQSVSTSSFDIPNNLPK